MRCPHKRNGCKWEGELGNLDQHSKSCPKRPWQCQHCDFRGTYDIGTTDHLPNCTKYPEPCPNQCDISTVPHCDMKKHLTECPLQLVECEFAQAGCRERIPRQDMSRHMEEGAQRHLLNMSLLNLSLTRELHQKMAEKDQQIAELQGQLQEQSKKLEEQIKCLQEQGKQTKEWLQKIETGLQGQRQEFMDQQKITEKQITGMQTQVAEEQSQDINSLQKQFRRETGNLQQQLELQHKVVEKGWQQQSSKLEEQLQEIKELQAQGKQTEKRLQKQLEMGLQHQLELQRKAAEKQQQQTRRLEEQFREIRVIQEHGQQEIELQKQVVTGLTRLQGQLELQGKIPEKQLQQQTRRLEEQFRDIQLQGQQTEKRLQKQLATGLTGLQGQIDKQGGIVTDLQQQTAKLVVGIHGQLERQLTVQNETAKKISEMQKQFQSENRVLQNALQQEMFQEKQSFVLGLYPTFQFTLKKFSVHKTKGGRGEWESDPFYSRPGGYKFQLGIDTNGFREAEGTHITADLYLLEGKHDRYLSWPIQVTAHLQLLNQRGDHGHVVASLTTTVNEDDEYIEIARKFIAHSELNYNAAKDTQYLKDECLHFRLYLKVICKA